MRRLPAIAVLASALLAASAGLAGAGFDDCDRNGDSRITIVDAQIALQSAISGCVVELECDADGDHEPTASDALALLRSAVGLPVELDCTCYFIDECFGDQHCVDGYPPGYFCAGTRCVECYGDDDCEPGLVCDSCTRTCGAAPQ